MFNKKQEEEGKLNQIIGAVGFLIEVGEQLVTEIRVSRKMIQERLNKMATKEDLDNAIAGLPAQIEQAVDAAVQPIIDAIKAKGGTDFQNEIDQLNAVGSTVAQQVTTDLTPKDGGDTGTTTPPAGA